MKGHLLPLLFWLLSGSAVAAEATPTQREAGIEFLWAETPAGALARQPTLGFVNDGKHDHQVCVVALPAEATAKGLVVEAVDAAGKVVARWADKTFDGSKRCSSARLDGRGVPGTWTYRAYFDGATAPAGSATIEVASTLESAPFYAASSVPYVLGRPNYDPAIPPEEFNGRLVWLVHADPAGKVTGVEIETAEGVGTRMKERAIAAGYLSMFPPDPSRTADFAYRRELNFLSK